VVRRRPRAQPSALRPRLRALAQAAVAAGGGAAASGAAPDILPGCAYHVAKAAALAGMRRPAAASKPCLHAQPPVSDRASLASGPP